MTTEQLNLYASLVANSVLFATIVCCATFGLAMLVKTLWGVFRRW